MKNVNITLTAIERKCLENLDKVEGVKDNSHLAVRKYSGTNKNLLALNGTAKNIGITYRIGEGGRDIWYLDAIDGERYRIPEPAGGIDEILDIEFKRKDV